jgi:hypothetical protein
MLLQDMRVEAGMLCWVKTGGVGPGSQGRAHLGVSKAMPCHEQSNVREGRGRGVREGERGEQRGGKRKERRGKRAGNRDN